MRLSLGLFRGIPGWLFQNASESRRNRGNRPETVELRRILDHYGPRTATHHITATAEDTTDPQQDARCSTLVASGRLRAGRVAIPVSPAALAAGARRGSPFGYSV